MGILPKQAADEAKQQRDSDTVRGKTGASQATRKEYRKAVKNGDWKTAHAILAGIVMDMDRSQF